MDLFSDVVLILRQIPRKVGKLISQKNAETGYHDECEYNHRDNRRHTAEVTPAQQQSQRRERETEKNREGHWDENVASEIKRDNRDHPDGQSPHNGRRLA